MSEAEGDNLWKAAKKYTSPSVLSFRMKSDWEQAGPLYEKAATCFRVRPSRIPLHRDLKLEWQTRRNSGRSAMKQTSAKS